MYTRVQNKKSATSKLNIPENYSGNAFADISKFNDSPTFSEMQAQPSYFDLDKDDTQTVTDSEGTPAHASECNKRSKPTSDIEKTAPVENMRMPSLFTSLFPSSNLKNHFPFGHGIGSEELLILGVMAVLFFSDDDGGADGELIMLLAMLLFAG